MKKLAFLFLVGVSFFLLQGCDSPQPSEISQRPLVRDQLSEEDAMFLSNAGMSIPSRGHVKGLATGEQYAYLYVDEEWPIIQLFAKTKNGGWVSLYNQEPEGISYDKLAYFQIPDEAICSTIPCFWVSEADKDSFYYQVILWESRN
jgi:hypothetical protein